MHNTPLGLSWELSVLERCVSFPNLSVAAAHVGLSQPQISRIVKKLEETFELELLDRSSRKHSHWTPKALKLAVEYRQVDKEFHERLLILQNKNSQSKIRIGTLEGLGRLASRLAHNFMQAEVTNEIELNIYDLNELTERFMNNELDLIFTSREMGRRKFPIWRLIGYQSLDINGSPSSNIIAESPSEEKNLKIDLSNNKGAKQNQKIFISNSLALRRYWIENLGASGRVPSELVAGPKGGTKKRALEPVYILGGHHLQGKSDEIINSFDPFAAPTPFTKK